MNMFSLEGKTALITGSSRGLGKVIAKGLAQAGAMVVVNGRGEGAVNAVVDEFKNEGLKAAASVFDVIDEASIKSGIAAIEREIGPVDILVNCAGINLRSKLEEFDLETWRKVMDVNLDGVFLVTREVAKGMIQRQSGKIINVCSLMSELGRSGTGAYTASKGGVKMLVRAMTTEWAKHNIQVNGIGPGYFVTDMTQPLKDDTEFNNWICSRTPAGRWGDPEELVGTSVFLASSASDFVNGQIIYVDGGILACL